MTRDSAVDRRSFLQRLGSTVGGAALAAHWPRAASGADSQAPRLRASDPRARYGGTLRFGVHSAPAHFDIHQSGTVGNIGPQGPMYDTLIRRDPRDGQTIIPDLAYKWDVSRDGKRYTFHLRRGVKFHDGAELTAADVKATYARITSPPRGIVIPRTPLFSAVGEINVLDPYRVEFRLSEPRPRAFMLGAFASGWNVIVRKKTLEENDNNLRQVMAYPGTGPFRHVSRKDKEVWILEKNPGYWNRALPYLDRLEIYHMPPFSPELGSALLAGKIDYGRLLDPVTWRTVKAKPNMTAVEFNQSVIQAVWVNNTKKPFGDPKVRRAMHLALDRHVLVDVVKDVAPMMVGGFVYPFHEFSTPPGELANRLGYERDPKPAVQEARRLMGEAGHAGGIRNVNFLVRDAASYKLWAVAIQSMLQETLGIETTLRTVQISQWFEEVQAGNFELGLGAIVSTLMDPSDYFTAWYGKDGPQNYSSWTNPGFHDLARQIERELDEGKRKRMVRQAELMLEQDPPLLPVAYERIYDGFYNYVRGQDPRKFFGVYDVVRWDTVWRATS